MLSKLIPNRGRSKAGSLTPEEKRIVKGMFELQYITQDIAFTINLNRAATVNQSVIEGVRRDKNQALATNEELAHFLKVQSSYHPKTLLNPYKNQRLMRAREAMISAVQNFNNPSLIFKAEVFCVFAIIAWEYLIHEKMEITETGSSIKDKKGNVWSLHQLLKKPICPELDPIVHKNLEFIVEVRDKIVHFGNHEVEDCLGGIFQSCCINFEHYLTKWFGTRLTLTSELSLALQFVKVGKEQHLELEKSDFPEEIKQIILDIGAQNDFHHEAFELNVAFVNKLSTKGASDLCYLVPYSEGSDAKSMAFKVVTETVETPPKLIGETALVSLMGSKGFKWFNTTSHRDFWKSKWKTKELRNKQALEYGMMFNGAWAWFEDKWSKQIEDYCIENNEVETKKAILKDAVKVIENNK